jgi:CHAT domain-containing protein
MLELKYTRVLAPALTVAIAAWACHTHLTSMAGERRGQVSALRAALIEALGAVRLTEGRLTGFDHAPTERSTPPSSSRRSAAVRAIQRQAQRHPTASSLADLAVTKLAAGRLAEAVKLFEQATSRDPDDQLIENDLAAVYIAQARADHRPDLLARALETVGKTHGPSPEALFNRALVLELLQLRGGARDAWHRYLASRPEPGWRGEAECRLAALEAPTRLEEWQLSRPRLEAAAQRGDRLLVARIVSRFRQETRILAQERLLAAWGTSWMRGDRAAALRDLGAARLVGDALVTIDGEHSVADAVAAIDRLSGSPDLYAALARGHAAYANGAAAHAALRIGEAKAYLAAAERELRLAGSPGAGWAVLWLAAADYYQGRHASASERLGRLLADPEINRYPALRGRARWEQGMLEVQHLELGRSLADFQAALRDFEATGELQNSGAVDYLLTENYELLGNAEEAWTYRERGLLALHGYPDSVWFNNLLFETAKDLLKASQLRSALAFHEEQLRVARRAGLPAVLAEALLLKARLESALGDLPQASRELSEADSLTAAIADSDFRQRMGIEALVARCQMIAARNPAAAIVPLSQAIDYFAKAGLGNHAAFCYLLRARARLAMHDAEAAEQDLQVGIAAYEAARDSLEPVWIRTTYLEQWQPLFDEMIQLQVARRRPERALEFAERAKVGLLCRELVEDAEPRAAAACNGRGPASLAEIQRALPEHSALIEYCLLPDRVLIWVVRRHSFTFLALPVTATEMERLVERLLLSLRDGGSGDEVQQAGGALFEHLFGSLTQQLSTGDRLIIVPDKVLSGLPFAALFDPSRRSYLVERHALSIEPSASFYAARRQRPVLPPSRWRLLSLAPLEGDGSENLVPLRDAPEEAAAIAAMYPRHRLLTGREATRSRFLAALRTSDAVEFAGHAVVNLKQPPLSRLVFTSESGAAGQSFLFARDLRKLPLGHLRLVVLSGCSTAPGSQARGEGFAGVAQAFLEAGAAAVLGTLWRVDDAPARHLAVEFHRRLLAGGDGASAVRAAQLALLHGDDVALRNPSGWGAFELVGALMEPEP